MELRHKKFIKCGIFVDFPSGIVQCKRVLKKEIDTSLRDIVADW